ncbi:DEAD/DEAH box helicase [Corynebacterium tapiri]|uniref:DEAD/DEAH box helicase n=1 Tax=Corynebacterium tapiri TaxID=1448266 RepID=A0A5C4U6U3_9CORY|nr:DEAD/DEAH box helicase [Corynebacterium tapiri]TNL99697.1 DEAD/DEAH box helicase [Corynebacterium tapiri]
MPSFLLHGLWLPESGLNLWVEQVEGHRIVLPSAVPEGTFPPVIERMLDDSMFRTRAGVKMQTPKGKRLSLRIPTASLGPDKTVRVLSQMAFLDQESPAATAAQRASIAADLYWLIRLYVGLDRFVKAGRLTIRLGFNDGMWWPQWQLADGLGERGWLAQMIAAAPGVLTANNPTLDEDVSSHLTHWIATARLESLTSQPRPYPWHDFVEALLKSRPLRRGGTGLLRALKDWRNSITAVNLHLVFIVEQPDEDDQGDPATAVWPVRVQVRSGTDAPRPVRLNLMDAASVEKLKESQERAITETSLVDPHRHPMGATTYLPSVSGEREGDWDVYLTTEEIMTFVAKDAPKLKRAGFTVMLPKAWSTAETTATVRAREVSESATETKLGLDKMVAYDWQLSVGETELTAEEMKELVRSKTGLIRLRGQWVLADTSSVNKVKKYMERLEKSSKAHRLAEIAAAEEAAQYARAEGLADAGELEAKVTALKQELADETDNLGKVTLAELREIALESAVDEPVAFTGSTWHESLLGVGTEAPAPTRKEIPPTVHAQLREYQRRGVDWLYWMSSNNLGAILADDMGLGKTLQFLTMLAIERAENPAVEPSLVVAPTSVVGNWAREAQRFVPDLKVLVHHGADRLKGEELDEAMKSHDLIITSYGIAGRDTQALARHYFNHVVLDEAQAIKNAATKAARSVRALRSRHRLALTGTPVENRLSEMRAILDFVNPGVLGSASFFRNHFARAIERGEDEEMAQRLRALTSPFILRRLKTDPTVIDDLPDKTEQIITVNMTHEQAALYTALTESVQEELEQREGMSRRGLVLATITRIKQICNHPAHYLGDGSSVTERGHHRSGKVAELMRLLDVAVNTDQRVLIFTQYRAFGTLLKPYLDNRLGEDIPFLHGGVSKTARDAMVARFQSSAGPRAMLLSLKAGGTGLNLTAASMVIHLDRWWNPAVENQATDRAFRIGQDRNVAVYKMITAGTLEESIQDILDGKTKLAGTVVGEGEGWITELAPEQLAELMSYREREAAADDPLEEEF